MNDEQLDRLIAASLKTSETDFLSFPEQAQPHVFSAGFEKNMNKLLLETQKTEKPSPHRSIRVWKWWFVLAAVLLAVTACSLTAYGSKTNHIHFFADKFTEYQTLEEMDENAPATVELTYDLDALVAKYESGVEIVNGEQYTRFFTNPETGEFFEFSSYPKLFFRWHTESEMTEDLILGEKELTYFVDRNQIQYALWSASSTVFVVRSDMSRKQFLEDIESIKIYEIV